MRVEDDASEILNRMGLTCNTRNIRLMGDAIARIKRSQLAPPKRKLSTVMSSRVVDQRSRQCERKQQRRHRNEERRKLALKAVPVTA